MTWRMKFAVLAVLTSVIVGASGCGQTTTAGGGIRPKPPNQALRPLDRLGSGEGVLNLIAWQGYADPSWVKPFQQLTGCIVSVKYAASSAEMLGLMKDGGGAHWDMVSASGDAAVALIYSGDVRPMNARLIPDFSSFDPYFQSPPYNTVNGVHYGISVQWGPNVLLYNTKKFPNPPTSWSAVYDASNKGLVTAYDNPITIADGALYLSKSRPSLGIKDPYELTRKQFDAAVALLTQQRQLIERYWSIASDEIPLFKDSDVFLGAARTYQTDQLKAAGAPVEETIPEEGATGWGDSWMLATNVPHPNCAYLWTRYVTTAKVQAEQALLLGASPVNARACAEMEAMQSGSCGQYHGNASAQYVGQIRFWKTPIATCDDGTKSCVPYDQWATAWTAIKQAPTS